MSAPLSDDPDVLLDDAQRDAVEHGDTPLRVLAGAGTGKTATLAARVARLVAAGADPQRLLLLTFSRRAAREMQQRVGARLRRVLKLPPTTRAPELPWAGTFHGVGARLLREHAGRIGLVPSFTILDRPDAEDLLGLLRHDLGLGAGAKRFPTKGTCLAIYSRVLNGQAPLAEVVGRFFPWCLGWEDELRRLFGAYVDAKQRQQVLDYDDLLLHWSQMMAEPALAQALGERFTHVLVDEYQDTNRLQAAILHALKPDGRGLTVVGDDAQSIYAFRAAEVRNILDFDGRFDPPARTVVLARNFRSSPQVLDACNAVIALSTQNLPKSLWSGRRDGPKPRLVSVGDELEQAAAVADTVLERREGGLALKRQAVLFRTAHHAIALELELARRRIPFVKYGGLRFVEAAHVKDVLSLLRWTQNPRGRSAGLRVALLVPGIGPAQAKRLLDAMDATPDPVAALADFRPAPAARAEWQAFRDTYVALHRGDGAWPAELERALAWYLPQLQRLHDDAAARQADLTQLLRLAGAHGSRERFLEELTLDPPDATSDEARDPSLDDDHLILSTIHSAKGLEWPAVSVLNVVDGCIPSDMACGTAEEIEEERRLLYVAMTRAVLHLDLYLPQRFHVHAQPASGDRHLWAAPSRFLPPPVQRHFEAALPPRDELPSPPSPDGPRIDVAAAARSLWR